MVMLKDSQKRLLHSRSSHPRQMATRPHAEAATIGKIQIPGCPPCWSYRSPQFCLTLLRICHPPHPSILRTEWIQHSSTLCGNITQLITLHLKIELLLNTNTDFA